MQCGLLLQMSYEASSVLGARVSCTETAEPIEMPCGSWLRCIMGSRPSREETFEGTRGGPLQRTYAWLHCAAFACRRGRMFLPKRGECIRCREGDKTAMRSFATVVTVLWTHYYYYCIYTSLIISRPTTWHRALQLLGKILWYQSG